MPELPNPRERQTVFISYSHKDRRWLDQLHPHLGSLARSKGIVTWDDTKIQTGTDWLSEIERAISSARVAILLVSPHFLNSDFIRNIEIPKLLAHGENSGLKILPIVVSPCRIEDFPELIKFQFANTVDRSLRKLSVEQRDMLFSNLSSKVEDSLNQKIEQQKAMTYDEDATKYWYKIVEPRYGRAVLIECRKCGSKEIVEARSGGSPSSKCSSCGSF